jgi:hypothetical protein
MTTGNKYEWEGDDITVVDVPDEDDETPDEDAEDDEGD